jgi:hypothetical protein
VCPGLPPSEVQRLIFENSTPITSNLQIPDAYEIVLAAQRLHGRRKNAD